MQKINRNSYRADIELQLIANILHLDAFGRICHILTEANFKTEIHKKIFAACKSLYPKRPINTITVWDKIRDCDYWEVLGYHGYLTGRHENELAFMLLTIDLTEKFDQLILSKIAKANDAFEMEKAGVLSDMRQHLTNPDNDILILINTCDLYFKNHFPDDEDFKEFHANLDKKVAQIKKNNQLNNILAELYNVSQTQSESIKDACQTLAGAISIMIVSQHIKPNILQAINTLKENQQ